jgi:hypothetical protein
MAIPPRATSGIEVSTRTSIEAPFTISISRSRRFGAVAGPR